MLVLYEAHRTDEREKTETETHTTHTDIHNVFAGGGGMGGGGGRPVQHRCPPRPFPPKLEFDMQNPPGWRALIQLGPIGAAGEGRPFVGG